MADMLVGVLIVAGGFVVLALVALGLHSYALWHIWRSAQRLADDRPDPPLYCSECLQPVYCHWTLDDNTLRARCWYCNRSVQAIPPLHTAAAHESRIGEPLERRVLRMQGSRRQDAQTYH